jgi:hypothetical protein
MKRKQMDSPEPDPLETYALVSMFADTLHLSEGGDIHRIRRCGGIECTLDGSITGPQDCTGLLAWETQLKDTIHSMPSTWNTGTGSPFSFKCTDLTSCGIQFSHTTCRFRRSQTDAHILDYDLQNLRWDTLSLRPHSIWVHRAQGTYGIQYSLREMVCSDIGKSSEICVESR